MYISNGNESYYLLSSVRMNNSVLYSLLCHL